MNQNVIKPNQTLPFIRSVSPARDHMVLCETQHLTNGTGVSLVGISPGGEPRFSVPGRQGLVSLREAKGAVV